MLDDDDVQVARQVDAVPCPVHALQDSSAFETRGARVAAGVTSMNRCRGQSSMDWFKGKSTGNHRFYH